jgi:hypothetical protein
MCKLYQLNPTKYGESTVVTVHKSVKKLNKNEV